MSELAHMGMSKVQMAAIQAGVHRCPTMALREEKVISLMSPPDRQPQASPGSQPQDNPVLLCQCCGAKDVYLQHPLQARWKQDWGKCIRQG